MRKTLCLVFLGCALVVGLACSGDSSTPTAPATTSGPQITTGESADRQYLCHGDRSDPTWGLVVEVSDETFKRHRKHINSYRDCVCPDSGIVGQPCNSSADGDHICNVACPG